VWRHVPPSGGCDDEHPQAGAGYDYLTRQVAALDATEKGHTGLASYYAERGESPGVWIGSGMDGIEGLAAGDPVTAGQMRALFGCGLHPLAELRQQQLEGPDLTTEDFQNVARLGAPFKMVDNDLHPFRVRVANRIAALNTAIGWPADASIAAADRAGADHILSVIEASRSTWQMWHVGAEAQRQVRTTGVSAQRASALVDLLVDEVLQRRSIALAAPRDGIEEPEVLRRVDGSSVYTIAGAALYTSQRILDAEQRSRCAPPGLVCSWRWPPPAPGRRPPCAP
jgi:TrwC relaxase